MRKKFFFKNLVFYFLPVIIPIFILGSLSVTITNRYVKDQIIANNINQLKQTMENIELMLDEINYISTSFDMNPDIGILLKNVFESPSITYDNIVGLRILKTTLLVPTIVRPYVQSIYVYVDNADGKFITATGNISILESFPDTSWYYSYLKQGPNTKVWAEHRQIKKHNSENEETSVITLYKRIAFSDGVIVLNISTDYLRNFLDSLMVFPEQKILVTDQNDNVLFSNNDMSFINAMGIDNILKAKDNNSTLKYLGKTYIISYISSDHYNWRYISMVPQSALFEVPIALSKATIFLLIISFTLSVALTYYLTKRNYKNVYNILSIIESAENGNPLPPMPSRIKDEYGYIIQNILKTFIEQSFLKVQLSERKYRLQTMELMALQAQMNPHFLYNTLETISWKSMAFTGKPNDISNMIRNLSTILKYSLSDPNKNVSIEEEINHAKSYIEIQKVRYRGKFDVFWVYDKQLNDYMVIKLLLQPLLENCIYHGIREKEGKSYIKVKVHLMNNRLKIAVVDNGIGITPQRLAEIRGMLREDHECFEHIGIFNTNKRLQLAYGDKFGIEIRSKNMLGTAIYIHIPANSKGQVD